MKWLLILGIIDIILLFVVLWEYAYTEVDHGQKETPFIGTEDNQKEIRTCEEYQEEYTRGASFGTTSIGKDTTKIKKDR